LLQNIIDVDGIEKFLDCEANAVKSLVCDNSVIATGGSVVFRKEAIEHLKNNGKIFYLNVQLDEIKNRLNNISTRGIAAQKGKSIDEIYEEREPLYKKYADYILDLEYSSVEQTIEKILNTL
jgi:shikimate kinase